MQRPDIEFAFDDINLPAGAGDFALEVFQRADVVKRLVRLFAAVLPSDFGLSFALYFDPLEQAAARGARAAIRAAVSARPAHPARSTASCSTQAPAAMAGSKDAALREICRPLRMVLDTAFWPSVVSPVIRPGASVRSLRGMAIIAVKGA